MGDGEIGYDILDYEDDSGCCQECGQQIDENFVWNGECLSCEDRIIQKEIEQEFNEARDL